MGSLVEINDTLQLTVEQGFPAELNLETHLKTPYKTEDFLDKVFSFKGKPKIRNYQQSPVRNFLVENRDGKWISWGLCEVLEVTHDYVHQTTSGKFKIIRIFAPIEMKQANSLTINDKKLQYFSS